MPLKDENFNLYIPNYNGFKALILMILHSHPVSMIPMNLPDFLFKLKRGLLPKYFIYSILAAGYNHLSDVSEKKIQNSDNHYAQAAVQLCNQDYPISDVYTLWSTLFIFVYFLRTGCLSEVSYFIWRSKL
ncbi:hypothetical protein AYI68_g4176 [Smittium mucronatum]|uniref:Uncharacterized protein n=1 Tax=Smittium mucronatum TaxID=133383 RepID=A0A1R0GXT2_9FUNG|nr:hypothetical protein AYI68_g4176 [Smittium mucronatum]